MTAMPDEWERERQIAALSQQIVELGMCAKARELAAQLGRLVKARTPAMVTRMERERGLA